MSTGKVKFFNETKGFGFIVEDDSNTEYFVHISGTDGNVLNEGENVSFDLEEGKRGMNAVNVKVI
ncbi:MAG: cold shock domain-containing protein [Candidatus Gracilibacteria bacterium]|nr:cold shock domain-containing protein [Candidatus Gracilibacteria bacterium]